MTHRVFVCICILVSGVIGCLPGTLEKAMDAETPPAAPTPPAKPPAIAELQLSLQKGVYSADEPIPLQMSVRAGKFDLLVPAASVEGEGAFGGLIVTDASGKEVAQTSPISWAPHMKNLLHDGIGVDCIHGVELKSGSETVAALENVRSHFNLAPGDYTLQVFMNLKVYREFLPDQSPQVVDIQKDILAIQRSRHSKEAKQQAIGHLREEIATIQRELQVVYDKIYLPMNSLRGSTDLESNVVRVRIE
ncbi:MAG: hypothetical protein OXN17_00760 [Candidatus Poribacteria bacterium]|nr:hypothetical protein [Candidatus Poribacteria bacterium]MDE0502591.1 hypothetical protein [Candidatus Poribacteria bacterium]